MTEKIALVGPVQLSVGQIQFSAAVLVVLVIIGIYLMMGGFISEDSSTRTQLQHEKGTAKIKRNQLNNSGEDDFIIRCGIGAAALASSSSLNGDTEDALNESKSESDAETSDTGGSDYDNGSYDGGGSFGM